MKTLAEIEEAVDRLTPEEKRELHRYLEGAVPPHSTSHGAEHRHGVLDIATVRLGEVLRPLPGDDDLLGEMLDQRP